MTNSQRIYDAALKYVGTAEKPGKGSNPLVAQWIKEAASWLLDGGADDSSVAWCGCFRGHIGMETMTGTPPAHYRALNWSLWGVAVPVSKPQTWVRGDTLIMPRTGGNHVALFSHMEGSSVFCLGGNQSDKVCIAPFPLARIKFVRRALEISDFKRRA
jgi:uncharacterized protein (TIGR02594 family)